MSIEDRWEHLSLDPDNELVAARLQRLNEIFRKPDQGRELLLYINPVMGVSAEPVIDEITGKITAAFRASEDTGKPWRGVHQCACRACSDNTDYILPSGHRTNSLAIHYVGLHRDEVPEQKLEIIEGFEIEPEAPTIEEFRFPDRS
jgi:hypothetical protein